MEATAVILQFADSGDPPPSKLLRIMPSAIVMPVRMEEMDLPLMQVVYTEGTCRILLSAS